MDAQALTKEIKEVIGEQLGLRAHDIEDEQTFDDLMADSLDNVEMLMTVEDMIEKDITDEEFPKEGQTTIGEFVTSILRIAGAVQPQ